jgi:Ribose/Galactose Isomerase
MKLLVLSGIPGSVDGVVDIIQQGNSVVAKESTMANDAIARAAQDALDAGSYDLILVIAKDPIGAGMVLNKREGLEAAVCDSADDARLAKDNGANVIIIKNVRSGALSDILKEVSGSAGIPQKIRASVKMPSIGKRREADEDSEDGEDARAPRAKKTPAKKQVEEDDSEGEAKLESLSAQRKDLLGKLKDALGIL